MASVEQMLVDAVKSGDVVALDGVLRDHATTDVNLKTAEGLNLLMVAIREAGRSQRGQFAEVIQLLIQVGCDVNAVDDQYGRTSGHWAVFYHKEDILMELLIAGADMTLPDYSGVSPFLLAIQENSINSLAAIMRYFPKEMLNYPDQEGRTPLLYAIHGGSLQMCSLLTDLGASLDLPDQVTGRTPLHWACLYGRKEIIEFFCQKDCDIQAQDAEGRLPVHLSAFCEQKEGLQVLFKSYGVNVLELVDMAGLTPLMYACASGLEENIKFLLKKKVNVLAEDNDGKCCLHWAVETATPEAVLCIQLLCRRFPELMKQRDHVGRTPLLWTCVQGTVSNLNTLMDLGDDTTVVDNEEHTAAHWATVSGNPKCLSLLVHSGLPVTVYDKNGATPLHYAAQNSRDVQENSPSDTLHTGSPQGILECLQILLDSGADVEAIDNEGNTPLHWGIQSPNNFTALSYIVGAGTDPNRKNNDGQTGLHLAARQGLTENCQFLLEAVGDVTLEGDIEGQTALFHSVEGGHFDCAQYLISVGANVNHLNHENRSPVHVAAHAGFVECVQLLASKGADLEQRSIHGALPIHEASASGHTDVLEFLLYNGCSVNRKVAGGTALHYAASGGHFEAARLLISLGVHINALVGTADEDGYASALDYAEASGNTDLIELIKSHGGRTGNDILRKSVSTVQRFYRRMRLKWKKRERKKAKEDVLEEQTTPLETVSEEELIREHSSTNTKEKEEDVQRSSPSLKEIQSTEDELKDTKLVGPDSTPSLGRPLSSAQDIFELPKPPSRPPSSAGFPSPVKPQKPQNYVGEPPPPTITERQQSVLRRALSLFKKETRPETTVDSAVALYSAAALMLVGAVAGGKLGMRTVEVGEKVARNRGDEVVREAEERAGRELPELVWDEPPKEPTPIPTPSPPPVRSPTPEPSESEEDPLDRRLRKAKAQLSLNRSVAFNAVNEMAKAQATNARLKREFNFVRLEEELTQWRNEVGKKEIKAIERSEKVKSANRERMVTAAARSKIVNHAIDEVLLEAKHRNSHLDSTVSEMGYSKRPTVAQWLEQKRMQKRRELQDEMVQWDRDRYKRELALTVTQTTTAKRAYKHMAWAKKKELRERIKKLKAEEDMLKSLSVLEPYSEFEKRLRRTRPHKKSSFPKPPPSRPRQTPSAILPLRPRISNTANTSQVLQEPSYDDIRITTQGFVKTPPAPSSQGVKKRGTRSFGEEKLWSYGENVARGKVTPTLSAIEHLNRPDYIRATGPKNTPRNRSLIFVSPEEYRPPSRSKTKVHPKSPTSPNEPSLTKSLEWSRTSGHFAGPKSPTTQYHSLGGDPSGSKGTKSSPKRTKSPPKGTKSPPKGTKSPPPKGTTSPPLKGTKSPPPKAQYKLSTQVRVAPVAKTVNTSHSQSVVAM